MRQREKFVESRKRHTKGLRWEILNIEVHSIFDAWNEQLIELRTKKSGYSGIGLNELTLSTIDQNRPLNHKDARQLMQQGKNKLLGILDDMSDHSEKMLKQNYEEMCYTDSAWIYYADEALSYGLELSYIIEEEIFMECAKEVIRNIQGIDFIYIEDAREQVHVSEKGENFNDDLEGLDLNEVSFESGNM